MKITAERVPEAQMVLEIEIEDEKLQQSLDQASKRRLDVPAYYFADGSDCEFVEGSGEHSQGRRRAFDKHDLASPAGNRLDTERAGTGEQVHAICGGNPGL